MVIERNFFQMMESTRDHHLDQLKALSRQHAPMKEEIKRVEFQLKQINVSPRENLRIYGDYMPQLDEAIEQMFKSRKFTERPLGPIGSYVEVIDPKYRRFVEDTIKGVINSFFVSNTRDRLTLSQLFKDRFPAANNIPIITTKFLKKVSLVTDSPTRTPN